MLVAGGTDLFPNMKRRQFAPQVLVSLGRVKGARDISNGNALRIGAGAILKLEGTGEIHGLTTAAGVWITAAIGVAIGLGNLGMAAIAVLFAWTVLAIVLKLERYVGGSDDNA